jgi:Xaa-Pro aminopeptidase
MVITVEPGIYFKATDPLVPEELRGIGVRIEDDTVVTDTGRATVSRFTVQSWQRRGERPGLDSLSVATPVQLRPRPPNSGAAF